MPRLLRCLGHSRRPLGWAIPGCHRREHFLGLMVSGAAKTGLREVIMIPCQSVVLTHEEAHW